MRGTCCSGATKGGDGAGNPPARPGQRLGDTSVLWPRLSNAFSDTGLEMQRNCSPGSAQVETRLPVLAPRVFGFFPPSSTRSRQNEARRAGERAELTQRTPQRLWAVQGFAEGSQEFGDSEAAGALKDKAVNRPSSTAPLRSDGGCV